MFSYFYFTLSTVLNIIFILLFIKLRLLYYYYLFKNCYLLKFILNF